MESVSGIFLECLRWVIPRSSKNLKKGQTLSQINQKLLEILKPENVEVAFIRADEADEIEEQVILESELDEMWSFVGNKDN